MKKNTKMAYAVLGIAFILFNVIAFAVPTVKAATFWIAYAFTTVAFMVQIGIWIFAFKDTETLKSKFLGIPLVSVGVIYLIIQLIAFAVFMVFPIIPVWIAVVVCALIVGISAICLIGTETGREEINRVEEKVRQKVFYIKSLQADIETLAEQENNSETKMALTKLAEKIRYSDSMSHEALADLEVKISEKTTELKTVEDKTAIILELNLLLNERNMKAKLLK